MAKAMKLAIESGRLGYEAGRIPLKKYGQRAVHRRNAVILSTRYSRQELFQPIGTEGQKRLMTQRRSLLERGHLDPQVLMLGRAGVGSPTILDRDYIEWSNLQRQQLYTKQDVRIT
ncbi:hypothetical protein BSAF29S_05763 [Bacillus safensis subsp. safensis]